MCDYFQRVLGAEACLAKAPKVKHGFSWLRRSWPRQPAPEPEPEVHPLPACGIPRRTRPPDHVAPVPVSQHAPAPHSSCPRPPQVSPPQVSPFMMQALVALCAVVCTLIVLFILRRPPAKAAANASATPQPAVVLYGASGEWVPCAEGGFVRAKSTSLPSAKSPEGNGTSFRPDFQRLAATVAARAPPQPAGPASVADSATSGGSERGAEGAGGADFDAAIDGFGAALQGAHALLADKVRRPRRVIEYN